MFRGFKLAILEYLRFQEALIRLRHYVPSKPNRKDVYRLAAIAAFLGYSPSDYDRIFNISTEDP